MTGLVAAQERREVLPQAACDGGWRAEPGFGVYVHIPFCRHRCHYCDFNTYEGLDALHAPYVAALVRHIETLPGDHPVASSVFFGGGTPTLLPPQQLARLLEAVRARVGLAPGAEVTVEANPETVSVEAFAELADAGFNRVSIGVQSLRPHVLRGLGRTHDAATALAALDAARAAGIAEANLDLIYGSPWERDDDWTATLTGVIDAGPDHISAYALTVEESTPLHTLIATGRVQDVDPDLQAARYEVAEERLSAAGYERYEVSNWARPGRASSHNVLYWSAGDYLGLGAGAHGHIGGRRYWSTRLPRDFIAAVEAGDTVEAGAEVVEGDDRAGEALMLGLRLTSGVDESAFAERFGAAALTARAATIDGLVAQGLLERSAGMLRLPRHQTLLANDVLSRLL